MGWLELLAWLAGAIADDPHRRRTVAVGGYTTAGVKVEAGGWREPADRRAIRCVGWSG
jgi:hypothetical protein